MFNSRLVIDRRTEPFNWVNINNLFSLNDGRDLSETYPTDFYRTIYSNSKDKQYHYDVRGLVEFSGEIKNKATLSESWQCLAEFLCSQDYRNFIKQNTLLDVSGLAVEANIYKYSKNCFMDAHQDLDIKLVTQVIYFNDQWEEKDGGCLDILRSKNLADVYERVLPVIGNSIIIIRSDNSWHSVETTLCDKSRRSVTVTFYKKGSTSPMWIDSSYPLHDNFD